MKFYSIEPVGGSSGSAPLGPIPQQGSQESPFRKMFGGAMTDEEFKQFINQFIKDMISQMKQNDQSWKEAMEELKEAIEGDG